MGENAVNARTLGDYFSPITTDPPSCIVLPTTTAAQFEIKPQIFQLLPNFQGMDSEDPFMHIKDFLEICSTFKFQNFPDESVRLRLFPFSLKDNAKAWLNSLPLQTINSWDILVKKFLSKNFPVSKTNILKKEITDFCQKEHENFMKVGKDSKIVFLGVPTMVSKDGDMFNIFTMV